MKIGWILIAALLFAGCRAGQKSASETGTVEKPLSAHGTADVSSPAVEESILKGKVLERLDAGRYSYLRLSTPSGETWAAVLLTDVKIGETVSIENPMSMNGFKSSALNRKFDRIVFGSLRQVHEGADLQKPERADRMSALLNAHAGLSDSNSAEPVEVEKAAGPSGKTIAEIYAQKARLKDQEIAVRGKVVKVNAQIMGRTWIHLRDGTGDPKAQTNDLTITTQDSAAVGDTITAKGIVRTDKNLGMGYVFSVLIEDAAVMKR
ncbi:MAG TPA: nucleotide-binding protein [Acidobacteriota bacterium]|nr:nucleotide-binding protein [Acidobacteriota bacterium]